MSHDFQFKTAPPARLSVIYFKKVDHGFSVADASTKESMTINFDNQFQQRKSRKVCCLCFFMSPCTCRHLANYL